MKNEIQNAKLPAPILGLLIFSCCVLIALVVYWCFIVADIIEQKRLAAETAQMIRHILLIS